MKSNQLRRASVMGLIFVLSFSGWSEAADMIYKIDGRVISSDEATNRLFVEFTHPATHEVSKKEFRVSDSAGFEHADGLETLERGDLVSVDYVEQEDFLVAIYIDHVPVDEVRITTKKEVAKALLTLGTASKSNDE